MAPVPSRNALRALRDLAFSTPTVVAGAVGSICCVAAACCETRSRVRLAEKAVATKRILRSISDGQGNARVTRMFEAAERGEDYSLLSCGPAQKKRRLRKYSSLAVAQATAQEDMDIQILQQKLAAIPTRVKATRRSKELLARGSQPVAEPDHSQTPLYRIVRGEDRRTAPSHAHQARKDRQRWTPELNADTGSSEQPMISTHRRKTDLTVDEMRRQKEQMLDSKPRNSDVGNRILEASKTRSKSDAYAVHHPQPRANISVAKDHASPNSVVGQVEPKADNSVEPMSKHSPAVLGLTGDDVLSSETDGSGWAPFSETDFVDLASGAAESNSLLSSQDPVEDEAPSFVWNIDDIFEDSLPSSHIVTASADGPLQQYSDGIADADSSFVDPDKGAGVRCKDSVAQAIQERLESGDLTTAVGLYHRRYASWLGQTLPEAATGLLHRLLATDHTSGDTSGHTLRIICPNVVHKRFSQHQADVCTRRIMSYMQRLCTSGAHPAEWKCDFYRLIGIVTRRARATLSSRSAETYLRALCSVGQVDEAAAIYDDIKTNFGMVASLQVDRIIATGYARKHDWTSVNNVMTRLQDEGVPREYPKGYSIIFEDLWRVHTLHHSVDASYEYLINALGYWKLVPNSTISRALITVCIKARMYNTIVEWLETIRQMWPRLISGVAHQRFAVEVGSVWMAMQASCLDVRNTCKALANDSLEDPFSTFFRSVLRDVICIALQKASDAVMPATSSDTTAQFGRLDTAIEQARHVLASTGDKAKAGVDLSTSVSHLRQELEAVDDIYTIVSGRGETLQTKGDMPSTGQPQSILEDEDMSTPELQFSSARIADIPMPESLQQSQLPIGKDLVKEVAAFYAKHLEQGMPPPHNVLTSVVISLKDKDRMPEALSLLRTIHSSPYVHGKAGLFFDSELYVVWLDMCRHTGAMLDSRVAMWSLLDASHKIALTSAHLIMASLCAVRLGTWASIQPRLTDAEDAAETEYLRTRLASVRWRQRGAIETDIEDETLDNDAALPYWQGNTKRRSHAEKVARRKTELSRTAARPPRREITPQMKIEPRHRSDKHDGDPYTD